MRTLRVQGPNSHILAENPYYNYYYPKPKVPKYWVHGSSGGAEYGTTFSSVYLWWLATSKALAPQALKLGMHPMIRLETHLKANSQVWGFRV